MNRDDAHIDVEETLRASVPTPPDDFIPRLERQLLPPPPAESRRLSRPLLAGTAVSGCMALAFLATALIGEGPLGSGGDGAARATDECRTVPARERTRVPVVVERSDGSAALRYRTRVIDRRVERCP